MSKDDRTMTILENINRISQFESGYAQIQFQLNRAIQSGLESKNDQLEAFKAFTGIYSCSAEEEKLVQSTIKMLEDDIVSARQREEMNRHSSGKRGTGIAEFESLFSIQRIKIGSIAVAFINGNWMFVKVIRMNGNLYPSGIVDNYPEIGIYPEEIVVSENNIIGYIGMDFPISLSTKNYILPHGKRVLALWPDTTVFYNATVKGRSGLPDNMIAVQFDDDLEVKILPYPHVIPYKKPTF